MLIVKTMQVKREIQLGGHAIIGGFPDYEVIFDTQVSCEWLLYGCDRMDTKGVRGTDKIYTLVSTLLMSMFCDFCCDFVLNILCLNF